MSVTARQSVLVLSRPVTRSQVTTFAAELSLRCVADPPWTHGVRHTTWDNGDVRITYAAHASSGKGLLLIDEPEDGTVAAAAAVRFECKTPARLLDDARRRTEPLDVIRALYDVSVLLLPARADIDEALTFLCGKLEHADPLVRYAAVRILRYRVERTVEQAFGKAAKVHAELAAEHAVVAQNCQAAEEGIIDDGATESWQELIRRARQGIADGKWKRVERAADMLLADRLDHAEALLLRALAFEQAGEILLALGLAAASKKMQARDAGIDESQDAAKAAVAAETDSLLLRLKGITLSIEQREASATQVRAWLDRFRDDDRQETMAGMAEGLDGAIPSLQPLFAFLSGRYGYDVAKLRQVLEVVPDCPTVLEQLGNSHRKDTPAEARELYRRALEWIDSGQERSGEAKLLESYLQPRDMASRGSLLRGLAEIAYDARDWQAAAELSDALVQEDPDSSVGWQMRANARTFALRHEEAARMYVEALEALDRIFSDGDTFMIGKDPRPTMHFNLSCVLAKLGERERSLDHLRHAVREDEGFCQQAIEDDYYGDLLKDPEFLAIVERDPKALVLKDELEREYVEGLAARALGLSHRGDVDEALKVSDQAARLAELGGHRDLLVRALSIRGRTLAFERDPGPGLELLERAVAIADGEGIDEQLRAETVHTRAFVLHAAGKLDAAETEYRRALALREEAYGPRHPVVAKSFGDIARLAVDLGRQDEAVTLMERAVALLEEYLRKEEASDGDRAEAMVDLATTRTNLAYVALQGGDAARALERMAEAIGTLESVVADGYSAGGSFMEFATDLTERLLQSAQTEEQIEAARVLATRLNGLAAPDDPAVRTERAFWRRLRRFVARMKRQGVTDKVLAETFLEALRGGELAPELRSVAEIGGLASSLAQRAARHTTFVVMAPMALQTAAATGELDDALEQLEGLCLASLEVESDAK